MSRLTEERFAEIHGVVLDLLVREGYDNLTMDRIADATRSSKATLYRQWGSKDAIVADALNQQVAHDPAPIDTGSLRTDLRKLAAQALDGKNVEYDLTSAMLHLVKHNPELARTVRERVIRQHADVFDSIIEHAKERGEIPPKAPALRYALVMLVAPALLCDLLEGHEVTKPYLYGYIDAVLLPLLTTGPAA